MKTKIQNGLKLAVLATCISLICSNVYARALVRMPTQEQLDKLCVQIRLDIDGQIHDFYYKHIKYLDERGFGVVYGKGLSKLNHFERGQVLNYEEAKAKYERLKREQP